MGVDIRYDLKGFRQGLRERYHSLYAPTVSDRGCVLFLPLNSAPNRKVFDLSGYGNHGAIYGAVLKNIGEEYFLKFKNKLIKVGGRALSFDGVDDYIKVDDSPSLNPTEEITICTWVWLKELKTQGIVGRDGLWHLECYGSSGDFAFEGNFGGEWHLGLFYYYPDLCKWYFVCSVFKTNYVGLHVNGEEVKTYNWGEGIGTTSPRNIYIGTTRWAYFAGDGKKLNGVTAGLRIYRRALSPREIKEHFELERVIFGV